jgi:hypothetical protein
MKIYGLTIPNFFVAILVGIILSAAITSMLVPSSNNVEVKQQIQPTVTIQSIDTTSISTSVSAPYRMLESFQMIGIILFIIGVMVIISFLFRVTRSGDYY